MNKKIAGIAVVLLAAVMLATPVLAAPPQEKKVPITLTWTITSQVLIEMRITNGVVHRHVHVNWDVELVIDGGPPVTATAFTERNLLIVPQKDGGNLVIRDYYVIDIPGEEGGFEGNALILLDGFIAGTPNTWEASKAHGLFKGTGAFEGQTINAGRHWGPQISPTWTGYLLNPLP